MFSEEGKKKAPGNLFELVKEGSSALRQFRGKEKHPRLSNRRRNGSYLRSGNSGGRFCVQPKKVLATPAWGGKEERGTLHDRSGGRRGKRAAEIDVQSVLKEKRKEGPRGGCAWKKKVVTIPSPRRERMGRGTPRGGRAASSGKRRIPL